MKVAQNNIKNTRKEHEENQHKARRGPGTRPHPTWPKARFILPQSSPHLARGEEKFAPPRLARKQARPRPGISQIPHVREKSVYLQSLDLETSRLTYRYHLNMSKGGWTFYVGNKDKGTQTEYEIISSSILYLVFAVLMIQTIV